MMADDSDDDKPLLFQFKNSKGSVRAKSSTPNSLQNFQQKPSKVFEVGHDDKFTVNTLQEMRRFSQDRSPSPDEPLANSLAARVLTHKPGQVKVYTKRKKDSDDENAVLKKLKILSSFPLAADSNQNGGVDTDGNGCREHDDSTGTTDNGIEQIAIFGVKDQDYVNGDTHIKLEHKKKILKDDRGTRTDDLRLSCGLAHADTSKAAASMGLVKAEEEDDHLPLSRLSGPKKNKAIDMKDRSLPAKIKVVKEEICDILVKEEEEDDDLPISKMSRSKKIKESVKNERNSSLHYAVKSDGSDIPVEKEEDDDCLPLSKMSRPKRIMESVRDVRKLAPKNAIKEAVCDTVVNKEDEDDHVPLNRMSCLKRNKESAIVDKQVSSKAAFKEAGYDITLSKDQNTKEKKQPAQKSAKPSNLSGNYPENKVGMSSKKQRDSIASEQIQCLSKEEEGDDHLPLSHMARSRKRKAPLEQQMPAEQDAGKEEEESRKPSDGILTTRVNKISEERFIDTSRLESEEKIEDHITIGDDVSLCRPLSTKSEKSSEVMQEFSGKGLDATDGRLCKSRAKQLLALSKSLRDLDSEEEEETEEEQEKEDDDSQDDDDDDEQEGDDADEDEGNDHIPPKAKVAKSPAVKSASRTKVPATSIKARASNQSKTRTPISSFKSARKIALDEESEDDVDDDDDDDDDEEEYSEGEDEEDEDDDDEEYNISGSIKRKKIVTVKATETRTGSKRKNAKQIVEEEQAGKSIKKMKDVPGAGGGQKWTTLEHNGVIFPPFYLPHGIKMLYEGKPVDLTPEEEEVATMFAVMKETDYALKPKFLANFWNDWKNLLGPNHVIQKLEDCDFTPIYEWHLAEKEKKKQLSSQEKKAIKEEKDKQEEKYMWAVVDGVKEKVGNFRVEPPGLFRGRGEHPKMGKLKRRIYPEDIVINIGANSPVPECSLPGHRWKEVRHDNTVTWLAYWNDPINTKEQKYVFLAASSTLKGQSDKEKYEKARVLKDYIEDIRTTYTKNFTSADPTSRQIAVATYLIDRLALRAGNEKDDDEADTVGCCSLKVEHVSLIPPSSLQFDFLGKDSIRYFNVVEVVKPVYEAVGDFRKDKAAGTDLFDRLDTNKLNAHLKNIMPQLTAKVFRTYNASITLDTLLVDTDGNLLAEKIAAYQRANKEVAILCNHQRSVSKSHGAQMERLEAKLAELNDLVDELEKDLERATKGKPPLKDADGNPKKNQNPDVLERKIAQAKQKMERMKLDMTIKEDLKTVALGTSKINYMDPRITVAWCKKHEVPIEKIFNKSLLAKFAWAMDVDMSFRF